MMRRFFQQGYINIFLLSCTIFIAWVGLENMKISDENNSVVEEVVYQTHQLDIKILNLNSQLTQINSQYKENFERLQSKIDSNKKEVDILFRKLSDKIEEILLNNYEKFNEIEEEVFNFRQKVTENEKKIQSEIFTHDEKIKNDLQVEFIDFFHELKEEIEEIQNTTSVISKINENIKNEGEKQDKKEYQREIEITPTPSFLSLGNNYEFIDLDQIFICIPNFDLIVNKVQLLIKNQIHSFLQQLFKDNLTENNKIEKLEGFLLSDCDFNFEFSYQNNNNNNNNNDENDQFNAKALYLLIENENWADLTSSNWNNQLLSESEQFFSLSAFNLQKETNKNKNNNEEEENEEKTPITINIKTSTALGVERAFSVLLQLFSPLLSSHSDNNNNNDNNNYNNEEEEERIAVIRGLPCEIQSISNSVSTCEKSRDFERFIQSENLFLQQKIKNNNNRKSQNENKENDENYQRINEVFMVNVLCNKQRNTKELQTNEGKYRVFLTNFQSEDLILIYNENCEIFTEKSKILSFDKETDEKLHLMGSDFFRISLFASQKIILFPKYVGGCVFQSTFSLPLPLPSPSSFHDIKNDFLHPLSHSNLLSQNNQFEEKIFIDIVKLYEGWMGNQEAQLVFSPILQIQILPSDLFPSSHSSTNNNNNNNNNVNNYINAFDYKYKRDEKMWEKSNNKVEEMFVCDENYFKKMNVMGDGRMVKQENGVIQQKSHYSFSNHANIRKEYVERVTLFYPYVSEPFASKEKEKMIDFVWTPSHCSLYSSSSLLSSNCLNDKKILYVGDSNMRFFYMWMGKNYGYHEAKNIHSTNEFSATNFNVFHRYLDFSNITLSKLPKKSSADLFDILPNGEKLKTEKFDVIVVNFASQSLSDHSSYSQYKIEIELLAKRLSATNVPVKVWLQTPPVAFSNHFEFSSKHDWRTLERILLFNQIADEIMIDHNIPRLPFFGISSMFDVNPDLFHHDWPVYANLGNTLLNLICISS